MKDDIFKIFGGKVQPYQSLQTFKQSKVFPQLTQTQSAVVTEGSVVITASLGWKNCQNIFVAN